MEKLVKCPYNHTHEMPASRLSSHMANKCKDRIINGHLFSQCPYNYLHHIKN